MERMTGFVGELVPNVSSEGSPSHVSRIKLASLQAFPECGRAESRGVYSRVGPLRHA
jgi:hypothetical protein